ncbi:MAG: FMN-binding protein [Acholeplasmataceae bacterium]
MKRTFSMFLFVILLGALTSGLLLGMDLLTRERININKEYVWRTTILDHHNISYTTVNFIDYFEGETPVIRTETQVDPLTDEELTIYVNDDIGYISLYFKGTGLWGPLEGILTMEADFMTIVDVSILIETETPGLGGVVAERKHLNQYSGQRFDSFTGLTGVANISNSESEIIIVSGATGTSNAFLLTLNTTHTKYARVFDIGEVNYEFIWRSAILEHNKISYTTENFASVFESNFETLTKTNPNTDEEVSVYRNKANGNISYHFEGNGFVGPIEGTITLASDFKTVVDISITMQTENRGGNVDERDFLDQFIGKEFDNVTGLIYLKGASAKNEIEILAGIQGSATITTSGLINALNATRELYAELFDLGGE